MSAALRVGFAGLGRMGSPMARNLAAAGFDLAVWNRTPATAAAFAAATGAQQASSPAALAARSDLVVTMVADGPALQAIYGGAAGAAAGWRDGGIAVDMSTVGPAAVHWLAEQLAPAGGAVVDAPVSGSVVFAQNAELTIMAGGATDDVDRARPVLEVLGKKIFHVGPSGTGAAMKLAVNAVVHALSGAISEALVLAEAAGVPRTVAYEVFSQSAIGAPFVQYKRGAFEAPESAPVGFALALAAKDLELALELAGEVRTQLPQAQRNLEVLREATAAGLAEQDMTAVAQLFRGRLPPSTQTDA